MKNSIIKVSIIIPIYNSQKYLRRCLDSILVQQIKEIEVIMVDDGSTDASAEICMEYKQKDYRFAYSYQKKKGVSAARNRGISIAKGEYIAFVDSDDTVEKNMFEKMYCSAKDNNSDICICDYYRVIGSERLPVTDSIKSGLYLNDCRQPLKIQFLFLNIILNSKSEKTYRNITFYIIINIVFT